MTALILVQGIAEEVVGALERRDRNADLAGAVGLAVEQYVGAFEDEGGAAFLVEAQFPQVRALRQQVGAQVEIGDQDLHILGAGQAA